MRPANHSRLSCMLAKALRSLTSRRISCWGMSLSPRLPMRTSDSLPKAALKFKAKPPSDRQHRSAKWETLVPPWRRSNHSVQNTPRAASQEAHLVKVNKSHQSEQNTSYCADPDPLCLGQCLSTILPLPTISEFHFVLKLHLNQFPHSFLPAFTPFPHMQVISEPPCGT